ncbi:MAG: RcpC/CpaB family pilus assembly protein [Propionibacterium sp.]|nr:RcpC/CpaB family pilus assembly protein [Propionibacterium sp.]
MAALLTVAAAFILVTYVNGADARARSALDPVPVLVVVSPVAKGTAATALGGSVQVKQLPRTAIAEGAVSSVADLGSRVAAVDLVPGEQVLTSRFVNATSLQGVSIPNGMQEVSVMLTSKQVYGGNPQAGDKVGVFLTSGDSTKLVFNNVLISHVEGGSAVAPAQSGGAGSSQAESGAAAQDANVMITFALTTHEAEQIVWTAEHGTIWLSLQNKDTNTSGSAVVNSGNYNK